MGLDSLYPSDSLIFQAFSFRQTVKSLGQRASPWGRPFLNLMISETSLPFLVVTTILVLQLLDRFLEMGKGSDRSPFSLILPRWSLWSWITMLRNFPGQPRRSRICHRPFHLTVSKAFFRSINVAYIPLFCSWHFSWSWRRMNTMSVVLLLALKPHWLSGRCSLAMDGTSLLSSILARTLPVKNQRVVPW